MGFYNLALGRLAAKSFTSAKEIVLTSTRQVNASI